MLFILYVFVIYLTSAVTNDDGDSLGDPMEILGGKELDDDDLEIEFVVLLDGCMVTRSGRSGTFFILWSSECVMT